MGRKGSGLVLGALILCGFALYAHTTVSFQKGSIVVDPGKCEVKNYRAVRQNGGHFLMVRCPGFSMSSPETRMISGDFDWRQFSVTFTTPSSLPAGLPSGVVEIALRSHGAAGDIWFDGLLLEEVK